jgi:hypothetical protein
VGGQPYRSAEIEAKLEAKGLKNRIHRKGHRNKPLSERESTAKTDGWPAYPGAAGLHHEPHVIAPMAAHVVLPWIHRVFSNLKTWALGVYRGLRPQHLQAYHDEFVFRFNCRRSRHAAYRSLLSIGSHIQPMTYKILITQEPQG